MKRMSLTITNEIEEEILKLRRQKKYCNYSKAELMRMLILNGIKEKNTPPHQTQ